MISKDHGWDTVSTNLLFQSFLFFLLGLVILVGIIVYSAQAFHIEAGELLSSSSKEIGSIKKRKKFGENVNGLKFKKIKSASQQNQHPHLTRSRQLFSYLAESSFVQMLFCYCIIASILIAVWVVLPQIILISGNCQKVIQVGLLAVVIVIYGINTDPERLKKEFVSRFDDKKFGKGYWLSILIRFLACYIIIQMTGTVVLDPVNGDSISVTRVRKYHTYKKSFVSKFNVFNNPRIPTISHLSDSVLLPLTRMTTSSNIAAISPELTPVLQEKTILSPNKLVAPRLSPVKEFYSSSEFFNFFNFTSDEELLKQEIRASYKTGVGQGIELKDGLERISNFINPGSYTDNPWDMDDATVIKLLKAHSKAGRMRRWNYNESASATTRLYLSTIEPEWKSYNDILSANSFDLIVHPVAIDDGAPMDIWTETTDRYQSLRFILNGNLVNGNEPIELSLNEESTRLSPIDMMEEEFEYRFEPQFESDLLFESFDPVVENTSQENYVSMDSSNLSDGETEVVTDFASFLHQQEVMVDHKSRGVLFGKLELMEEEFENVIFQEGMQPSTMVNRKSPEPKLILVNSLLTILRAGHTSKTARSFLYHLSRINDVVESETSQLVDSEIQQISNQVRSAITEMVSDLPAERFHLDHGSGSSRIGVYLHFSPSNKLDHLGATRFRFGDSGCQTIDHVRALQGAAFEYEFGTDLLKVTLEVIDHPLRDDPLFGDHFEEIKELMQDAFTKAIWIRLQVRPVDVVGGSHAKKAYFKAYRAIKASDPKFTFEEHWVEVPVEGLTFQNHREETVVWPSSYGKIKMVIAFYDGELVSVVYFTHHPSAISYVGGEDVFRQASLTEAVHSFVGTLKTREYIPSEVSTIITQKNKSGLRFDGLLEGLDFVHLLINLRAKEIASLDGLLQIHFSQYPPQLLEWLKTERQGRLAAYLSEFGGVEYAERSFASWFLSVTNRNNWVKRILKYMAGDSNCSMKEAVEKLMAHLHSFKRAITVEDIEALDAGQNKVVLQSEKDKEYAVKSSKKIRGLQKEARGIDPDKRTAAQKKVVLQSEKDKEYAVKYQFKRRAEEKEILGIDPSAWNAGQKKIMQGRKKRQDNGKLASKQHRLRKRS